MHVIYNLLMEQRRLTYKVRIFWEGHKIWKNLSPKIWGYSVASNFQWKIFSNFVAFSEYPNFETKLSFSARTVEMNLFIRVNLLVVFLLDALLDAPEWGFDPDSFCCLEWSWVLRVLWDMVLYPWCGLFGFFPTSNRWFIFAMPENNIGPQVESG